jgi:hypothetical protein
LVVVPATKRGIQFIPGNPTFFHTNAHPMTSPARITRPARKEYLKPAQLTCYLAGAVGVAAMLGAPQAEAAVTAVTFGFGPQWTPGDGNSSTWAVSPGFGTMGVQAAGSFFLLGITGYGGYGTVYHNSYLSSTHGRMSFFADGTVIGNGSNGSTGSAFMYNSSFAGLSFATDQFNKNIAFKTSTNHWGWANVNVEPASYTLTINSAYVESIAGNSITVGDIGAVPEPSRALLALAGLGGVALRRRRKQAA